MCYKQGLILGRMRLTGTLLLLSLLATRGVLGRGKGGAGTGGGGNSWRGGNLVTGFFVVVKSTMVFSSLMCSCMLLRTLGCLPLQALIEEEALASSLVQNLPLPYFALNTFCKASAKFQLQVQRIARGQWSHFNYDLTT